MPMRSETSARPSRATFDTAGCRHVWRYPAVSKVPAPRGLFGGGQSHARSKVDGLGSLSLPLSRAPPSSRSSVSVPCHRALTLLLRTRMVSLLSFVVFSSIVDEPGSKTNHLCYPRAETTTGGSRPPPSATSCY